MSKFYIYIILLMFPILARAQVTNDARLWTAFSLKKEFNDLELAFGFEYRLDENFSHTDKILGELGAEYKINKRLSISSTYRYSKDNDFEDFSYVLSHRIDIGFEYEYKIKWWGIKGLEFKNRAKYQIESAPEDRNNDAFVRNKFKLDYKKKDFSPYLSYELFYQFNNERVINRTRIALGAKYDITKKTAIKCFYTFESRINTNNLEYNHLYGIGYSIDL